MEVWLYLLITLLSSQFSDALTVFQVENEKLKKQVEELKQQLIHAETMNGRKQVASLPTNKTDVIAQPEPIKAQTIVPAPVTPKATDSKQNKKKVYYQKFWWESVIIE